MKDRLYNAAWNLGVRLRNTAKQIGVLGFLEPTILKLAPYLIPPPSKDVEVTLPLGAKMVVPSRFPSARSYSSGLYEPDVTALFQDIVKAGVTVVDLGANVGYYTLIASQMVGPNGMVYAFEPDPRNYKYLLGNIKANDCPNVIAVEKAVSNSTMPMNFILDPQGAEGWLIPVGRSEGTSMIVQAVSLDDFFGQKGWPSIDLIKMDIEGGEKAALEGMSELSRRNPGMQLIMELNLTSTRRAGVDPEALFVILQKLGFCYGYIIEQGLRPYSVAHAFSKTHATYNLLLRKK